MPGGLFHAIGNPESDGTWTYTWEKGRQLKRMQSVDTDASFVYNENGLRVQKTVNGVVTNYTLHGKNIVHMTQGSDNLHFFYDAQGKPSIVEYNDKKYAYIYNLQGDIVAILDSMGAIVVSYVYDAWGRPIKKEGSLAETLGTVQPFRYRGYVFDEETGVYYLRSRYYSSVDSRFLNADDMLGRATVLFSHNPYAYCYNYVINAFDPSGRDIIVITDESFPTHTSLLIQNFWGSWHYFYWGASADGGGSAMIVNAFSNQPGNGNMIYTKLKGVRINKKDETTTLANINNYLHDSNLYTGTYTKLTYISCFSFLSHNKANELTENQSADTYNLLTRNCAQVSLEVLGPSLFLKHTSLNNILFEREACIATLESKLYDVGSNVLPIWIHNSLDTYLEELESGGINP